ncbi:MAG: hypothetical protein QOE65_907 [Solirubrobacteraceae bacterium]|jgi:hypothetical protein|nr:hypothetical protein [Solirubrobacteraceae bacterium]
MFDPRRIAAFSVALSLAAPAGALAQSGAGDTQYGDPFEGQQRAQANTGSSGSNGSGSGLSNAPPGSTEAQAARTRTPRGQLARTGGEPGLIALLGLGLVMTGAGLRVRVRRPLA